MELSSAQASVLVAMPVLVGSLGRIPVGMLTDRFGGRAVFTLLLLAAAPVLLLVAVALASSGARVAMLGRSDAGLNHALRQMPDGGSGGEPVAISVAMDLADTDARAKQWKTCESSWVRPTVSGHVKLPVGGQWSCPLVHMRFTHF